MCLLVSCGYVHVPPMALFGLVSLGLLVILLFRFATLLLAGRGKESLPSALEAT